jgi:hypothetical protein
LFYTCRVVDSDGEFLLIEAADYLPDWANPETCEQRVGTFTPLQPDNKQDSYREQKFLHGNKIFSQGDGCNFIYKYSLNPVSFASVQVMFIIMQFSTVSSKINLIVCLWNNFSEIFILQAVV